MAGNSDLIRGFNGRPTKLKNPYSILVSILCMMIRLQGPSCAETKSA